MQTNKFTQPKFYFPFGVFRDLFEKPLYRWKKISKSSIYSPYPHSPYSFSFFLFFFFFFCWNCEGIKGGKEKENKLVYQLRLFCGVKCFPEPVEITVLPSQSVRRVSGTFFGKLWIWGSAMYVCIQLVFSADAATSRRYNRSLSPEALTNTYTPIGKSIQSRYVNGTEKNFFLRQEATLFRHTPISFLVRAPRPMRDCYFCIYFILCLSHFFMLLLLFLFLM